MTVKEKELIGKLFDILHHYLYVECTEPENDVDWMVVKNDREAVMELRHKLLGETFA